LGDLAVAAGLVDQAEQYYRQVLAIGERLITIDPANTGYWRDLSVSYNKLADLAVATGQLSQAEQYYRQVLAIGERLITIDPANTDYRGLVRYAEARIAALPSAKTTE
jgi:tetratricopeptide (TPR) repeat protein